MKPVFERLKKKGLTLTPQRMAVVECLISSDNHLTVEEIYSDIRKRYPTTSKATVYSTLRILEKLGEVQELSIRKRGEVCFETTLGLHHHFMCTECGRIIHVEFDCPGSCPILVKKEFNGNQVDEVQAYLYGKCSDCRNKGKQADGKAGFVK